jgi:hypothetical protein
MIMEFEEVTPEEASEWLKVARESEARPMAPTYEGVGDDA